MSRYSFLTAYLADPAPQNTRDHGDSAPATTGGAAAHAPQRTASAATQNTRHSSPTPAAQPGGGGRRVQAPSVVKPGGANSAGQQVAPPDMRKPARRTATYTPAEPNSQISGAPSGAETTETSTPVTASPIPDPEPHWWGSAPNITEAAQEERAFILDAVQSGIGGVSITGTNLHATLLTWDGTTINYPEPSRPEPIDTVTRITLNTDCTVLSIPPRALAQLRSLVVGGENLILANTSLGFTRTLGRGALVLSESGYATLAIAIIG